VIRKIRKTKKPLKTKTKNFPKDLRRGSLRINSLNHRVFNIIFKLIKETAKGAIKAGDAYIDLFGGFDTASVCQKFRGTYYANMEERRIREKIRKEWEIKKTLKGLHFMNYIRIDKNGRTAHLAEKGILEFIKFGSREKQKNWDGKWRMVIFDISENKRKKRDFLRARLKWLGYKELQKSVWVFPYDTKRDIKELLTIFRYDLEGDVRFLTAEKIEQDDDLRREFDLS